MKTFLKNLESENFRLRFLKFSEINSWSALDNYTRIYSFILNEQFEIGCNKWYLMYLSIVKHLQTVKPLDLARLINAEPVNGRCKPFSEYRKSGYISTGFGLYLRNPGTVNNIIPSIKNMLKLYGFNPEDAYLVVELTPDCVNEYSNGIIKKEKEELFDYLKRTYVEADRFYNVAIKAIDEMNQAMDYYSTTTYNNLYLLSEMDYDKYSNEAIERQLTRFNNTFTRSELEKAVMWLRTSRFMEGDFLNPKVRTYGSSYIVDGDKRILVTFKTHFMEDINHE